VASLNRELAVARRPPLRIFRRQQPDSGNQRACSRSRREAPLTRGARGALGPMRPAFTNRVNAFFRFSHANSKATKGLHS